MKYLSLVLSFLALNAAAQAASSSATAFKLDTVDSSPVPARPAAANNQSLTSRIEAQSRVTDNNGHPYDQLLTIQAGPYKPKSVAFTNWNNNSFTYDDAALSTYLAQLGWSIQMFRVGGTAFYFGENLAYSSFSLKLPQSLAANPGNQSVTMHMFGFDTRLAQAWETFPVAAIVPFWEGGFQYTLYNQSSPSDLTAGEGSATNLVAGLGLRIWVNRAASLSTEFPNRYQALPVFITAKINQIFSNKSGVDPSATSVLGGVSIGL
ncbi:MAG: hypothetical protein HY075_01605 [Deltaproteobacteria bacterium]|nr:hypothetical protein [Deltaproteobacteria bacterium]